MQRVFLSMPLLALWAVGAQALPSCHGFSRWGSAAPCPFKACRDGPFTMDLSRCSFCDTRGDGSPLGNMLYCNVCRPGTTPVGDRYRQECLITRILQCAEAGGGSGCSRCRRGTKMVTATRAPAVYSLASRPQQGGFCPNRWDAVSICRTCPQLGCPRRCRKTVGCTSCPRGSVLLKTGPPLSMKNLQWWGYCSASAAQVFPLPVLPRVCMSTRKQLKCKKVAKGVGCLTCPRGMRRVRIPPHFIAGSQFLQMRPVGWRCV
ncbi:hypothetical protein ABPG75_004870 [Micractinium tetrahymenae]